jgi:hypothetical protein
MQRDPGIPHASPEMQIHARQLSTSEGNCGPTPRLIFDPADQFLNVSPGSPNQYVAPGPGDVRGPCPGINAAANHDFLPHNGVPSIAQSKWNSHYHPNLPSDNIFPPQVSMAYYKHTEWVLISQPFWPPLLFPWMKTS